MTAPGVDLHSGYWSNTDRIVLAPMEGVVDSVMRDILTRIGGIDLCISEFIRVTDRLLPTSDFRKYIPELFSEEHPGCTPAGVPVLAQLLGGKPQWLAENAKIAVSLGAHGIDLNFGCPAKTVNRHDGGATLLKDPSRIYDVVSAVRNAVPSTLTVSAKVRLGFSDKEKHVEIARAAADAGASWLTVHARTRDEGYRPPAHWPYIRDMAEAVQIPVLANGDIWTLEDFKNCREITGCRHVMLGRGLVANPNLALAAKQDAGAAAYWPQTVEWLNDFAMQSLSERNEHFAVCRCKQWLRSLARTWTEAETVFSQIKSLESLNGILAQVQASVVV